MVFNIVSNHLCGYFIANCSDKISVFPKLSTSQFLFHFGMLLKYYTGTDALEHSYHFGNRVPRWKGQKNMNMVLSYLKGIYLKIVILGYLFKYFLYSIPDVASQNPLSIFRSPHQMVFRIIDRMARSFQLHAGCIPYLSLSLAGELFIPVYKTGYSSSNFHKAFILCCNQLIKQFI